MTVPQLAAVLSLIGTIGGGYYFVDSHYATKYDVQIVAWRGLERDYEDKIDAYEAEITYLEALPNPTPQQKSRLGFLKARLKVLYERLEEMKKK